MSILYILLSLLAFGVLIFIHELGHFIFARIFGVSIKEFSIGMGPKIWSRISQETGIAYSLRLLPIGGYVSMVGEDDESDDPDAFCHKAVWKRIIITAAGAVMNLLLGFLIMTLIVIGSRSLGSTIVARFDEGAVSKDYGLLAGDEIVEVEGRRVHTANELTYAIVHDGIRPVDITVLRDGETIILPDVCFGIQEAEGVDFGEIDFYVFEETKTPASVAKHALWRSVGCVTMIWESLIDLLSGRYGLEAMSGPIGVTGAMTDAAKADTEQFFYLLALISVNLGIFNLIPFPALDGGRLFFMVIELIIGRPVNRKIEGYVHFIGITVLMLFMLLISFKDVLSLFK